MNAEKIQELLDKDVDRPYNTGSVARQYSPQIAAMRTGKARKARYKKAGALLQQLRAKQRESSVPGFASYEQLVADGELPAAPDHHTPKIEAQAVDPSVLVDQEVEKMIRHKQEAEIQASMIRPVFEDDKPIEVEHQQPRFADSPAPVSAPEPAFHPTNVQRQQRLAQISAMPKRQQQKFLRILPILELHELSQSILPQGKQRRVTTEINLTPGEISVRIQEEKNRRDAEAKPCCYCRKPRNPKYPFCSATCARAYKANGNKPLKEKPENLMQHQRQDLRQLLEAQ